MVTMKEIAKECGVSLMAVSKALRGEKDISPKTTERVREVAKQMGYTRNVAAVQLKTKRSYMLGVLFADSSAMGVTHELFSAILSSIIKYSKNKGYAITFIEDKLGSQKVSYLEYVRSYGCDGVLILVTSEDEDREVLELIKSEIPVVTLDYIYNGCSAVLSDNADGIESMIDYAVSMGHKKIAMVHGEVTNVTKKRMASYHRAISKHGLVEDKNYVQQGKYQNTLSAENATNVLLELKNPPTFIMYQDDFSTIGGMNALEKMGLTYPKDISIAGYDGMLITQVFKPKLMTWKQDTKVMGEKLAELLIEAIEKPKSYTPKTVTVDGELLKGGSIKNLNE